jgi:hypothetical protein
MKVQFSPHEHKQNSYGVVTVERERERERPFSPDEDIWLF